MSELQELITTTSMHAYDQGRIEGEKHYKEALNWAIKECRIADSIDEYVYVRDLLDHIKEALESRGGK